MPDRLSDGHECFRRTKQEPESIEKLITLIRDFHREESTFDVHPDLLFRLLRRVEEQADTLKLVEDGLHEFLTATVARRARRQQRGTIAAKLQNYDVYACATNREARCRQSRAGGSTNGEKDCRKRLEGSKERN